MEVEADAEVVEEAAEVEAFLTIGDAFVGADGFVVAQVDVVARVGFEGGADVEPGLGVADAVAVEEGFDVVLDGGDGLGEFVVVGEVEGEAWGDEVAEFGGEVAEVEIAVSIVFVVLDEEDGAVFAEESDDFEPVGVVGVFFAIVGDEDVEGAFGEEELVGLVVDFLAAEVPDVDAVGDGFVVKVPLVDVDALGADVFGGGGEDVVGVEEFVDEGGFADFAFADDEDFGFVEGLEMGIEVVVQDGLCIRCFP